MVGQSDSARHAIRLLSTTGYLVEVEFSIRRDTIEVWYQDRCQAVMDRDLFRIWLERHPGPYAVDDVMWTSTEHDGVALLLRNSGCWLIPDHLMAGLHERI